MNSRITGTELETSILIQDYPGGDFHCHEGDKTSELLSYLPSGLIRVDQMLSNGGRFYPDVGSHIEIATPEDASFMGTVANEIAAERIVYETLQNAMQARRENPEKGIHDFILNKRIIDDRNRVWGYHASFLASARHLAIDPKHLTVLGLHLATHNLFAGAGMIYTDPATKTTQFAIAQKALALNYDFYMTSHGELRPLVSTRDEPHAFKDVWKRVHVTSIDANMSPWATWMRLGTISLVLGLIERGYRGEDLRLPEGKMYQLAHQVATDLTMKQTVTRANGRTILPLEIQGVLIERAEKLAETEGLSRESQAVLEEWKRALIALQQNPLQLIDRADWVAKQVVLEEYMDRHGLKITDRAVRVKDRQWDNLGPKGIGQRLRQTRWARWMPPEGLIRQRQKSPPGNSRAYTRGKFIRHAAAVPHAEGEVGTDWGTVSYSGRQVLLGNPYRNRPDDDEVDALINSMK